MSVASDIILISIAIQSNGILSYTLNIFKTKRLLKSTQLFTRSEKLVATVLKIYHYSDWVCTAVMSNDVMKNLRG